MFRFGPAGIPSSAKGEDTAAGVKECSRLGLAAMEVEFVRGVYMTKEEQAEETAKASREKDISLSIHCPYWVNCCGKEEKKINLSVHHIFASAQAAQWLGVKKIVFHPGYYMGRDSKTCGKLIKSTLQRILDKMEERKVKGVLLAPETAGAVSEWGSLEEILWLSNELDNTSFCIDFCHLHARQGGVLKGENDYLKVFEQIEKSAGKKAVENIHIHFSGVEFGEKGERKHLPIDSDSPPWKPFMKLLAEKGEENGYGGTIICESPLTEKDALKMKNLYDKLENKK
ncbi:endonuclease 4 [Candidatus Gugararchaeum adminiculabundum]|nr:endonuclease 4 [Candidatus Gugararchaeum adminiculabundum]